MNKKVSNADVADAFDTIGDLLQFSGENPFRIRAYHRAALNLRNLSEDINLCAEENRLEEIPGIGKDLASKIQEMLSTGRLKYLEELKTKVPPVLAVLMTVPGIGPKKAKLLYDKFKIKSLGHLEELAKTHKLRGLPGMEAKTEDNILRGLQVLKQGSERMPLGTAIALANDFVQALKSIKSIQKIVPAGSLRRQKDNVRDIDILVVSAKPKEVMEKFVTLPWVTQVLAHGNTKSSVRARGAQVDVRVVEAESFGAALVYFTGSKEHNVKIRGLAKKKGLTVNEYGVFKEKGHRYVAGKTEEDVYEALGLPWMTPELREDRGEVEAALTGQLPRLVEMSDIRGDFHIHSNWTDGAHPIEEMVQAVRARGYEYMLLSDHSRSLKIARGLTPEQLGQQRKIIDKLNEKMKPFRILLGTEMEILPDGSLDYPDSVLKKLDVVIAAVHSAFKQSRAEMTQRVVKAIRNPYVNILAHPTGRLWGEREPYDIDLDEVAKVAAKNGTALEINSYNNRLDLNDVQAKRAHELGAMIVISTDSHVISNLNFFGLGLSLARRAWLGPRDLLNTRLADEVLAWVAHKRIKG